CAGKVVPAAAAADEHAQADDDLLLAHEPGVHAPREPLLEGDRAAGHSRDVRAPRPPALESLRARALRGVAAGAGRRATRHPRGGSGARVRSALVRPALLRGRVAGDRGPARPLRLVYR